MSQIIENRSDIDGVVEDVDAGDNGDLTLHVRVEAVRPVGTLANLLSEDVGEVIAIRVREGGDAPPVGAQVSCQVRKTGVDRFFAVDGSLQVE
jgi:hypothetical protein